MCLTKQNKNKQATPATSAAAAGLRPWMEKPSLTGWKSFSLTETTTVSCVKNILDTGSGLEVKVVKKDEAKEEEEQLSSCFMLPNDG